MTQGWQSEWHRGNPMECSKAHHPWNDQKFVLHWAVGWTKQSEKILFINKILRYVKMCQ